ncbi:MAG: ThuA domain-containing protein [Eubacteriales bacterium]|nr:ThuA domain-containing protein [Eubacteriales bacterium]
MKQAIIFQGGWDGHEPVQTSARFASLLRKNGFSCTVYDTMDPLDDPAVLEGMDLLVMCWTMGQIKDEHAQTICRAVAAGMGLAGCHGGMCDAFRACTEWQFMTGGQWVSHPGGDGVEYMVHIHPGSSPITQGLTDFKVCSEQYYLHVDPAIEVLATTRFPTVADYNITNKPVDMPVAWTKFWGNGRVFYTSLGHHDDVFDQASQAQVLMERGMLWAAQGRALETQAGADTKRFETGERLG